MLKDFIQRQRKCSKLVQGLKQIVLPSSNVTFLARQIQCKLAQTMEFAARIWLQLCKINKLNPSARVVVPDLSNKTALPCWRVNRAPEMKKM